MSLSAPSTLDPRLELIKQWLTSAELASFELDLASLRPASADASFRRYFRIGSGKLGSLIVMDAAPPQENVTKFVKLAQLFTLCKLSVPQIYAQELAQGFLLISDFGSTSYLHQLNADTAHRLYVEAIDAIILLQMHSQPEVLPEYDRAFLLRELELFPEWYIGKHLQIELTEKQQKDLRQVFDAILANNMSQAQVFVHRDFHSRNLMVLAQGNPGVIDFQDAVFGPITYDLASLLRDAYVQWDEEMVLDWAIRYWEKAKRANLPVNPDIDAFYRDFEFMGLQRHLKILGIFCRLHHRDGKDQYLQDLPLVLEYIRKTANRYTELRPLVRLLDALENKTPQVGYTF